MFETERCEKLKIHRLESNIKELKDDYAHIRFVKRLCTVSCSPAISTSAHVSSCPLNWHGQLLSTSPRVSP